MTDRDRIADRYIAVLQRQEHGTTEGERDSAEGLARKLQDRWNLTGPELAAARRRAGESAMRGRRDHARSTTADDRVRAVDDILVFPMQVGPFFIRAGTYASEQIELRYLNGEKIADIVNDLIAGMRRSRQDDHAMPGAH